MGNWLEQPSRRARFRLLQMIFVGTTFDFFVVTRGFRADPRSTFWSPPREFVAQHVSGANGKLPTRSRVFLKARGQRNNFSYVDRWLPRNPYCGGMGSDLR